MADRFCSCSPIPTTKAIGAPESHSGATRRARGPRWSPPRLADAGPRAVSVRLRSCRGSANRGFADAARVLQFDSLEDPASEDKELPNAPPDDIRRALVAAIRRERPSIVVTFDPNGLTMHLDHLAISRFTSDAMPPPPIRAGFPNSGPSMSSCACCGRRR